MKHRHAPNVGRVLISRKNILILMGRIFYIFSMGQQHITYVSPIPLGGQVAARAPGSLRRIS